MKHELYSNTYADLILYKPEGWKFSEPERQSVTAKLSGWVNALYWNAATLGKAKVYVVYDGKTVIHTSFVVRGKEKFLFLKEGDIEIGPCWTHPDYRGYGIYPAVLTWIV